MAPSCAEGGVLGILPGLIGVIQATEGVKIVLGKGDLLIGRLLLFDAMAMEFRQVKFRKNPKCPVCSDKPTITQLIDYDQFCNVGRGQESAAQAGGNGMQTITVQELKALMDQKKKFTLVDVREENEYQICRLPNSKLIPLGKIPELFNDLNPNDDIVVHCHHGGRSAKAIQFLQTKGYKKLRNLTGGIHA
jgi:adenylyltransferase/sulfurtransferase